MEQTYLIILRLFHIATGVFWAGGMIYLARFVLPAAKALGPDGGKFMSQLAMTNNLPIVMMVSATLNILSGVLLFWKISNGFSSDWMGSSFGATLSLGGLIAIVAYTIGLSVNRPATFKLAAIAKQVAAAGGVPTPEQVADLNATRMKLVKATNIVAILLGITVVCMAVARYM